MKTDRILLETLKLLTEIAWSDREIQREEEEYLLGLAAQAGADARELESLRASLADSGRLPAPDLHLLRGERQVVLDAVDQLIAIDDRIVADEVAARDAVARLLERA